MRWAFREWIGRAVAVAVLAGFGAETMIAGQPAASGRVLDLRVVERKTNNPIAGAELRIRTARGTRNEVADDQGRFRISYDAGQPEYLSVTVSKQGFVPIQLVWRGDSGPVTIPAEYTLAMDPGTSIGGIIQDEDGKPIEGVRVSLLLPSGRDNDIERAAIYDHVVRTDEQGRWRCDIMPARFDDIWIRLQHPDYISDEMYGKTPKPPIERLREMTGTMVMKRGIVVAGHVRDANDQPIARATIAQGSDRFGSSYPSTRSNSEGRFEFRNVRPDRMVLTVQAKGYAPDLKEITVDKSIDSVDFRLERGRTLRGRIVDKAGHPVAGAFVAVDTWRGNRSLEWRVDTDPNGRFRWDSAPADDLLVDMGKQNYMSIRHYSMTASDQEYTITMNVPLKIKGKVTDEATGQPIAKFTIYPGIDWGNGQPVLWERRAGKTCTGGAYEIRFDEPRVAHLVQVEAEGYLPRASRPFTDDEGEVVFDLALKKGAGVSGIVRLPDGQPAVDADVILCTPSQAAYIQNGRNERGRDSASVRTGQDGRFSFPAQVDPYRLVVLHDKGLAEMADRDFVRSPEVTLTPWGRVEGKVMIGSKAGASEEVRVLFDRPFEQNAPRVEFDCSATADKDGHFTMDRVPPGKARLCRGIRTALRSSGYSIRYSHAVPIEVKAGQTLSMTIGGQGRPVVAKLVVPDSLKEKIDWQTLEYRVGSTSREEGYRNIVDLVGKYEQDGTLRVEDVPAGDYTLSFSVYASPTQPRAFQGERIGSLTYPFTVPAMPGGRSDEPLDLGNLELLATGASVMAPPSLVGKNMPDLQKLGLPVSAEELNEKPLLICFFDMQQRPSRNAVSQLSKQADSLKQKGLVVVAVQALPVDEATLKAWLKDVNIPLPIGRISSDEEKTRFAWGMKALPWLILTDKGHVVRAEGFALGDLEKIIQDVR